MLHDDVCLPFDRGGAVLRLGPRANDGGGLVDPQLPLQSGDGRGPETGAQLRSGDGRAVGTRGVAAAGRRAVVAAGAGEILGDLTTAHEETDHRDFTNKANFDDDVRISQTSEIGEVTVDSGDGSVLDNLRTKPILAVGREEDDEVGNPRSEVLQLENVTEPGAPLTPAVSRREREFGEVGMLTSEVLQSASVTAPYGAPLTPAVSRRERGLEMVPLDCGNVPAWESPVVDCGGASKTLEEDAGALDDLTTAHEETKGRHLTNEAKFDDDVRIPQTSEIGDVTVDSGDGSGLDSLRTKPFLGAGGAGGGIGCIAHTMALISTGPGDLSMVRL
jgi:hypothetical protein